MKLSQSLKMTAQPTALLLAALLAGATSALAASPTTDANFIQQVVRNESTDARLGQLAVENADSAGVKKLGQMLIRDHAATGEAALRIANTMQVSLPGNEASDQDATYRALSGLSGEDFDRAFVDAIIRRTQTAIAEYEAQAASGDSTVAAFAEQQLPILRSHYQMARTLKTRMGIDNTP